MPTQSLSNSPQKPRLSLGQLVDRTVTDFVDGKGAWDRRQWLARNQAAETRAAQEWSRMSLAQKIPIIRREVEIREEVPEYQSRFGVAIDKELEAAGARFAPRGGDSPSDYHKLDQDEKALFNIALNEGYIPPDHAYVGPVRAETMRLDGERLKAELGDSPLAHRLAFERLAVESPASFERYKLLADAGELPREHPFERPATMAAISDALDGPPMLGPTGFALEEAEVRFDKLLEHSDDREWLQWSSMDREERARLAREYAADPTRSDRPLEAPVAHFNMMEAGKAHFETLDEADREKIREKFLATSPEWRDRNPFHDVLQNERERALETREPVEYASDDPQNPHFDDSMQGWEYAQIANFTSGRLAAAEEHFKEVRHSSSEHAWRDWSKMDPEERAEIAAKYQADPAGRRREYEAPVAYYLMNEAGKQHFETLDPERREEIKKEFLALDPRSKDNSPYQEAVYLDIAKSDLPIGKMPFGAISAGQAAGLPRFDPENLEQERAQAQWDRLSATTKAAYVVQYAHDGKLPAHEREREYAAQAARFDWTKESAALAKEWEKLSPEQRKEELDAYKAALATPRHPYEHHIRAEFANELKGLAEHGPQFAGLANVRELKGLDGLSQEAGGRAVYSSPAPASSGAVALNPKAAAALDRIGRQSSAGLDKAERGARAVKAPKLKPVELGGR
jgi:hypothetical protein